MAAYRAGSYLGLLVGLPAVKAWGIFLSGLVWDRYPECLSQL